MVPSSPKRRKKFSESPTGMLWAFSEWVGTFVGARDCTSCGPGPWLRVLGSRVLRSGMVSIKCYRLWSRTPLQISDVAESCWRNPDQPGNQNPQKPLDINFGLKLTFFNAASRPWSSRRHSSDASKRRRPPSTWMFSIRFLSPLLRTRPTLLARRSVCVQRK